MLNINIKQVILTANAITCILIMIINFLPNNLFRIILGLPFVLFLPGFVLLLALYPKKDSINNIERVALSFGMSLAVVPLIGLILNYLPWGIRLNPILYSLSIFIITMSLIGWIRQKNLSDDDKFSLRINFGFWIKQDKLGKFLSILLVFAAIGLVGVVAYTIAVPRTGEQYTEFYVLDMAGKADNYPIELNVGETSRVLLGIINHEQQITSYRIEIQIDGVTNDTIGPVALLDEEKYEVIGEFKPQNGEERQMVEFVLFKEPTDEPYLHLQLWIDVKQDIT